MARPREFEITELVDHAVDLFWLKGFDGASLDDVLARADISKSSLYGVFSSKTELLAAALQRYGETGMFGLLEPLSRAGAERPEIEEAFANIVEQFSDPGAGRGCLMTDCAVGVSARDPRVRENVRLLRSAFEHTIRDAVARGQARGTISCEESAVSLGRLLTNALNGMSVLAKLGPDRAALEDIARLTLRSLGSAPAMTMPANNKETGT